MLIHRSWPGRLMLAALVAVTGCATDDALLDGTSPATRTATQAYSPGSVCSGTRPGPYNTCISQCYSFPSGLRWCLATPPTPPPLDRSCVVNSDCAVLENWTNQCGVRRSIGVSSHSIDTFNSYESFCRLGLAPCTGVRTLAEFLCPQNLADDGLAVRCGSRAKVFCNCGQCVTNAS